MQRIDLTAFLSIHNGTPIKLKSPAVNHAFPSKVIGMHRQWLIVDYHEAMDVYRDALKPGCPLSVRFIRDGSCYQFSAVLKRIVEASRAALVLGRPGPLEKIERRRIERIPCDLPGHMEVKRNIGLTVVNINRRGCRVRFPVNAAHAHDFRKGDSVKLRIKIPERHTGFIVEGEVRQWQVSEDHIEAGILFYSPPNALNAYIEHLNTTPSLE